MYCEVQLTAQLYKQFANSTSTYKLTLSKLGQTDLAFDL